MADNNKLKEYEKNMTTWCKSVLGKYRIMKKLNKDAYKKSITDLPLSRDPSLT